jgi:hypothetical protein
MIYKVIFWHLHEGTEEEIEKVSFMACLLCKNAVMIKYCGRFETLFKMRI